LLKDPKLPYDLHFLAGKNGANLYVPGAEPVYIALNLQATIEEQKEVIRLLQPRMQSHGYQRYSSSLQFHPEQWDDLLTALGPSAGDTREEAEGLEKMGNIVRSLMGRNGPEALAAALAEMHAMKQQ
jgi:hypothetical protein